jgi:hypothetical protein
MQRQFMYRVILTFSVLLLLLVMGCGVLPGPAATVEPTEAPVISPTSESPQATATSAPTTNDDVIYQDDFTNPATGWTEEKFDNYFVGYHEPEYYHIEITSPNYKIAIFSPGKESISDASIEIKTFTVAAKTATEGDFAYGVAFRRSGDQYYAFTVSPRTKKWYVLKSSSSALEVLSEGTDKDIHDLDTADVLRVDALGSDFAFLINDKVVGQVSDADYAIGEVGFFVQTFDSANVHVHFDDLAILKAPEITAQKSLYEDDFTNPATNWPEEKFDNYFVGYHEPEYYHIEITSPNYKTAIFSPDKQNFDDATIEVKAFTVGNKTATEGDFTYGAAFRRSGDQYYAFTVSPRTKKWYVLKSSSSALVTLAEGTDESIHDLDAEDDLRVDIQGSDFTFHINNRLVGEVSDPDYATGEVGFFVQTFDSPNVHIHFDDLAVRDFEEPQPSEQPQELLYEDDFTNPATSWPEKKFDNYFVGYHEPEFYHIEITSPNYKTAIFAPEKQSFSNITVEAKVFTVSAKTATEGDFTYGPAFRRSGDQYYAFTVSPRTKKWYVLKSSSSALVILAEGTDESIHDLDTADVLRVDAQGPDFIFHINDRLVGQVSDADYATGEVGFFVQTFDSANVHVHFDDLSIQSFETLPACTVNALALNVRTGPGTSFASFMFLAMSDTFQPIARTESGNWLKVRIQSSDEAGWVFNSPGFVACSTDTSLLPVENQ